MPSKAVAAPARTAATTEHTATIGSLTKRATTRKATGPSRRRRAGQDVGGYILNVVPSRNTEQDWTFADGVAAGAAAGPVALPPSVDLRQDWWSINNQEATGSCVGWATADGVLRQMFVAAGRLGEGDLLSPRYIWMAAKETDSMQSRPETFIEGAGTTLKAAVDVARKFGAATMDDLPFRLDTTMYAGAENAFYARCARLRIASYFNLRRNLGNWKLWLAQTGPILVALNVDASWDGAGQTGGEIKDFQPDTVRGGHAVCIVGYREDGSFIVRNSWGTGWGDNGFGYLDPQYIADAFFDEAYGATL